MDELLKEWLERLEEKVDQGFQAMGERMASLETKVDERMKLRSKVLYALAALALAAAGWLAGGCAYTPKPGTTYANPQIEAQYKSAAIVSVSCIYPELPENATDVDRLLAPFWGTKSGGSAFAVGPRYAMTARHVTDCDRNLPDSGIFQAGEPEEIILTFHTGKQQEFVVVAEGKDETYDAALLVSVGTEDHFKYWVKLADSLPKIDETVCLVTLYPYRNHLCGPVTHYPEGDEWMGTGYVYYGLQSIPGNSGSAIYNSDGEVVAINVAGAKTIGGGYLVSRWRNMVPWYVDLEF